MSAPIIEIRDVSKSYDASNTAHPALSDFSLEVAAGEALAVLGPSGSGKSTLLNLIAGLDRPSKGVVRVAGTPVHELGEAALAGYRRERVGMVFQFFNLLDDLTVEDNVLIPAQLAGTPRGEARDRANGLATILTLMLVTVAGLGVLNTVLLDTRERVHDLGVLKALGLKPRQTVGMVLASVTVTGVVAGAVGVPLGILLQRTVLPAMAGAAGTDVPGVDLDVFHAPLLLALSAGGLVLATLGALAPATWAARARTATALRTE